MSNRNAKSAKGDKSAKIEKPPVSGSVYWRNAESKRSKILACAGRRFLDSGFAETTLDQVAADSNLVKQTIYNYYETKESLFKATIEHLLEGFSIDLNAAWYHLEAEEFLLKVAQLQLDKLQNKAMTDFLQLAVKECRSFPELQDTYATVIMEPMIDFVATYFVAHKRFERCEARMAAWCFRSAITAYGSLLNLDGLVAQQAPAKKKYLSTTTKLFAQIVSHQSARQVLAAPEAGRDENLEATNMAMLKEFFSSSGSNSKTNASSCSSSNLNVSANANSGASASDKRFAHNQAAVLAAAVTVFSAQGFAETSMEQIASAAGVSKQTVYSRFKSKDALFRAMCNETLSRLKTAWLWKSEKPEKQSELFLRNCHILLDETRTLWVRHFFRVVVGESKAFPQEANLAILFLYDFGRQPLENYLSKLQIPEEMDSASLSIALRGTVGSFVLLCQVFQVGKSFGIQEFGLMSFLLQVIDSLGEC